MVSTRRGNYPLGVYRVNYASSTQGGHVPGRNYRPTFNALLWPAIAAATYAAYQSGKGMLSGPSTSTISKPIGGGIPTMTTVSRKKKKKSKLVTMPAKTAGKMRRLKKRKVYKRKSAKRAIKGITLVKEAGGKTDNANCVYVGHSTCPQYTTKLMVGRAIGKSLFMNAGQQVQAVTDTMNVTAGDQITITYRVSPVASLVTAVFTYIAGALTVEAFAIWFADPNRPWNAAGNTPSEYYFLRATLTTGNNNFWLRLDNAIVTVYAKSSFKLQNRSTNEVDKDSDVVDNIPVYGKRYVGTGTGSIHRNYGTAIGVNGDNTFGVISAIPTVNALEEPPQPHEFTRIRSFGKVKLEPGEIKTSVLVFKRRMTLDSLWQKLGYAGAPATTVVGRTSQHRSLFGKFGFMAIEKIMDPGTDTGLSIAWEHNLFMQVGITAYWKDTTLQLFERTI